MLDPKDLDHLNRQTAALADYLARRLKRSDPAATSSLTSIANLFRAQLRYRRAVERRLDTANRSRRSKRPGPS